MTEHSKGLNRRALTMGLLAAFAAPAMAADHPSLATMRQVAKDMLQANRLGTAASFRRAIVRHADVSDIADYSLGQYNSKLSKSQRSAYYEGVTNFMSRYFADMSRDYRVAKYDIGEATATGDKDVQINTKVYMMTGNSYTVVWRLAWRGGRYKVTDVKVLGFSLVYMQRGLFTSFVSKRKGDVSQLVAALNR